MIDIDVLIVSPQYDQTCRRDDVDLLWHIAAQTDNRIEPVPVGLRSMLKTMPAR
jgi:hypothetical protein